ncbi:hypothetical protein Droror1_Dr00025038 [Drosera rotundifolia]
MHGDGDRTSNSDGQHELGDVTSDLVTIVAKNPRISNLGVERPQWIPTELMDGNPSTRTGNNVRASNLGNSSKLAGISKDPQKPTVGGKSVNHSDYRSYVSLVSFDPVQRKLRMSYFKPVISDGVVIVEPKEGIIDEAVERWHDRLVAYFVGKRLPFKTMNIAVKRHKYGLSETFLYSMVSVDLE